MHRHHDPYATGFVRSSARLRDHPALVLNADYRPLSYFPLSLWPWQEAVKATFLDRVAVVAEYDAVVRSPSAEIRLPSVVVLREFVKPGRLSAFTRFNLFLRDGFACQYCGSRGDMTFDHVIPRARGGRTTWENVVAACGPCNLRKGSRTLKQARMALAKRPRRPDAGELRDAGRRFPPNFLLYWDAPLDP
jgi:5-methylcytosine-specific restriction endonuclease McrA